MARGGARVTSGPAPDPTSLRQLASKDGWLTLPAEGRAGEPPSWPLVAVQPREWELWEEMWCRPQALAWERLGQELEVAMFVRKLTEAEQPGSSVALQTVVRQYFDSLGLSAPGMARNRWKIAPAAEVDAAVEEKRPAAKRRPSSRDRLKVVSSGDGA